MKIKPNFILREVAGQIVVVPIGKEALNLNGIITLNTSGKHLWEWLQEDQSVESLTYKLMEIYDVCYKEARKDVEAFIDILKERHILEDE